MTENELLALLRFYVEISDALKRLRKEDEDSGAFAKALSDCTFGVRRVVLPLSLAIQSFAGYAFMQRVMEMTPRETLAEVKLYLEER